jgi:MFS-type transporter involved in bile tolerance (Atg22 family)
VCVAGAALGTVLFPILQARLGLGPTSTIIAGGCVIAAIATFSLRSRLGRMPDVRAVP